MQVKENQNSFMKLTVCKWINFTLSTDFDYIFNLSIPGLSALHIHSTSNFSLH